MILYRVEILTQSNESLICFAEYDEKIDYLEVGRLLKKNKTVIENNYTIVSYADIYDGIEKKWRSLPNFNLLQP